MDFNSWTKGRLVNWIVARCTYSPSKLIRLQKSKLVNIAKLYRTYNCLVPVYFSGSAVSCGSCANCRTAKRQFYKELCECLIK